MPWRGNPWRLAARLIVAGIALLVGACAPTIDQVLPTAQSSPTPSPVIFPLDSPTSAPNSGSNLTPFAAASLTSGPSPTPLLGIAPPSARFTATPQPQVTLPGVLRIEYFVADPPVVRPGDAITFYWSVKGTERATISRLNAVGERKESWEVAASGQRQIPTRAADQGEVQFVLSVGSPPNRIERRLTVSLGCETRWFFEPQPPSCPSGPPMTSASAQQLFQRGQMIWLGEQQRIYVLYQDGKNPSWAPYPDEFKDGQPESDPAFTPPSGLLQPIRGFGLLWRGRKDVRDRLGWAIQQEQSYTGQFQGDATVEGGVMYIRARDGSVLELGSKGATWKPLRP